MFAFFLGGCSKNDTGKDKEAPVITLVSPSGNAIFNPGEIVNIAGTITDANIITEVHVHISNNTTGNLLIDIHRNPQSGSYALRESFQTQTGIQYRIQVIAKDNSANEARATVEISSN
jgi:hypothetical protein